MTPTPQDSGVDQPLLWGAIAAIGAVIVAWAKKASPWPIFQAIAKSLNAPMYDNLVRLEGKVDSLRAVIDEFPGATKAKAAAKAKREGWE